MSRDQLLTIPQVCAELGDGERPLSRATFYRWRATGKGPKSLKLPNGQVRVRRSALEKFLAGCEESSRR
jgi:predicted DNA-binding transcriptional regulator AlpA